VGLGQDPAARAQLGDVGAGLGWLYVVVGPDGAYYVSQLTGFPFPVGAANVYRVVPGSAPR
jgi:hypothetical protein